MGSMNIYIDTSDNGVFGQQPVNKVDLPDGDRQHQQSLDDLVVHVHLGVLPHHLRDTVVQKSILFSVAQEGLLYNSVLPSVCS